MNALASPGPMPASAILVPDDLSERDQWVLWRHESRNATATKVPYQANPSARRTRASSTDARTWASFEEAVELWRTEPNWYAGLGFVFAADDPFCGIDLDDCLDPQGNVKPWARRIIERFGDTYMETSPSGSGLKIWARGSTPSNLPGVRVGDGQIEIYDHARYFTVTGRAFRGAPLQIEDHAADLQALHACLTQGKRRDWKLQPLSGGRIPYGQQHNTLVSIAGTLRARRVCDEAIEACLQTINARQCERPGSPECISQIVQSSRRWGAMR
jgi:hypothetical protein